jgi:hypothetical protein
MPRTKKYDSFLWTISPDDVPTAGQSYKKVHRQAEVQDSVKVDEKANLQATIGASGLVEVARLLDLPFMLYLLALVVQEPIVKWEVQDPVPPAPLRPATPHPGMQFSHIAIDP